MEDGVSELGALYALEVEGDAALSVSERCHASFEGGSASTPSLRQDGTRVYVGDNDGELIAIEPDCSEAWRFSIGAQIIGSVAVASDGGEVYAATATEIVALRDEGSSATLRFRVTPGGPETRAGERTFNLNLVAISESGLAYQAGAGRALGDIALPRTAGVGLLDRETGAIRHFVEGLDETVAVMTVGPDGGLYIGNSPLRRAIHRAVYGTDRSEPLRGGITRFAPDRRAVAREAMCALVARADNALAQGDGCPESVAADIRQMGLLAGQARALVEPGPALEQLDSLLLGIEGGDLDEIRAGGAEALDRLWP